MKHQRGLSKILLVLLAAGILLGLASCGRNTDADAPYLVEDDSFFRDFRIDGDSVVFSCRLVLFNPQDSEMAVEIVGDFSQDAEAGLVREDTLTAVSAEDQSASLFVLSPGRTELDVVFVGTHGSGDVRQDRLLPEIEIVPAD